MFISSSFQREHPGFFGPSTRIPPERSPQNQEWDGWPTVTSWFINLMNQFDVSTMNHTYIFNLYFANLAVVSGSIFIDNFHLRKAWSSGPSNIPCKRCWARRVLWVRRMDPAASTVAASTVAAATAVINDPFLPAGESCPWGGAIGVKNSSMTRWPCNFTPKLG